MANQDIREALIKSGVKHWELAEKVGVSPSCLSVKLRHELSSEEKYKLFSLIQEIVDERGKSAITCPKCGKLSFGKYCPECGTKMEVNKNE